MPTITKVLFDIARWVELGCNATALTTLAGKKDMHNILDVFEFRCGVSCH